MAQTRYPNVVPYMSNVNGVPDRTKEREKAHLARERNVDQDGKKVPSFPSPIRVEETDDGISAFVKNVLGDFTSFKRIIQKEKVPACIGVVPVPATPTELKTCFGPGSEAKEKRKLPTAEKGTKEAKPTEKLEPKPHSDVPKHKAHRAVEKLNFAEYKAKERKLNESNEVKHASNEMKHGSNEVKHGSKDRHTKSNNAEKTIKCSTVSSLTTDGANEESSSPANKTSVETTSNKSQEEKNIVRTITKSEGSTDTTQPTKTKTEQSSIQQKTRPSPIKIPTLDTSSFSSVQNVHHNDMKVQNILKEMTEPVCQPPLTGIYTPISKEVFPFTKDDQIVSNFKSPVQEVLPQKDAVDEKMPLMEIADEQQDKGELDDGSSSSCSSSSDESGSSDSEAEEVAETLGSMTPKLSNLNAVSPRVPSSHQAASAFAPPKPKEVETKETGELVMSNIPSTNTVLDHGKNSENHPNVSVQNTSSPTVTKDNINLDDVNTGNIAETELNSITNINGEANSQNSVKSERVSDDDKKIKTGKKNLLKEESVKTEKAVKPTKLNLKTEPGSQVGSKTPSPSCRNILNDERTFNEPLRHKKIKDKRKDSEKADGEKKVPKIKLENLSEGKNTKHKTRRKSSESTSKKKGVTSPLNKNNLAKFIKEPNEQTKKHRLANDHSDEESDIDVVSCVSPAKKKKKDKCNGLNGRTKNGHIGQPHEIPLDIEIVHDPEKEPKSLLVKIDLSLLNRIPKKAIGHSRILVGSIIHADVTPTVINGVKETTHPEKVEPERKHKKKENDLLHEEKSSEQMSINKKKPVVENNKRSPSWESHPTKRPRHDSDRSDRSSQHDRHTSLKPRKTVAEQNAEVEEEIRKASPDTHLQHAKTLKREADKLTDREAKSRTYIEAIIHFVCCGRALEDKEETEPRATQMYSETEDLLKFVLKRILAKSEDKRLIILCLRLQSLLLHKLYRAKSKQALKNSQILAEHFKASQKNNIASPYTANKHASTPSPMSPTPSPAGSIGSIGSSSSDGTSSQNTRPHTSGAVTSPVSISIPQRVYTAMSQQVSTTSKLIHSMDIWDTADSLVLKYPEFFSSLDSQCGALAFHSSIAHVVNYVKKSLAKLQEPGKET